MTGEFAIGGITVGPGESKNLTLPIALLPIHTPVTLPVSVFRAEREGPTLLLIAGVHGNELTGIEVVRRMIAGQFLIPERGTVIAMPLVNPHGFLHKSREFPDGRDLNRNFPGHKVGSLAAQVAYVMMNEILPHADVAIDLHAGGTNRYNIPQVRCHLENPKELVLAQAFGAGFIVNSKYRENSFREKASKKGIPTLVYEGGESLRLDEQSVEVGIEGIQRIMDFLKIKSFTSCDLSERVSVTIASSGWTRAKFSGMFRSTKAAGERVRRNEVVGSISDPFGEYEKPVKAHQEGYIIGINYLPIVNKGDALFHIGMHESTV
jgi:predicted deacylase